MAYEGNTSNDGQSPDCVRTRAEVLELTNPDGENISRSEIAREIGHSLPTVSQWLSCTYTGNYGNIEVKLRAWLNGRKERRALDVAMPARPPFFETPTTAKIRATLTYAHIAADLVLIMGGAGNSKSETCRQYRTERPNVWHVEMTRSDSRLVAALEAIAEVLNIRTNSPSPAKIQRAIHNKLRGTNGLLIIDEAQHLHGDALEAIRGIHDATGIGLAIVGNESVYTRITGGTRSAEYAQLFSRIGKRLRLNKPVKADVDALANAWNVPQGAARELLQEIGARPGALRVCTKVLRMAAFLAAGKPITAENIRAAHADLGGEA